MPLLVDVANVLHVTGVLPPELAGPDEVALADMVARSRWKNDWVRLICDGGVPEEQRPYPSLDIVLCRTGRKSADDVIFEVAAASSFARRIEVVSNDRDVQNRTRRLGCRSKSADSFLQQLADDMQRGRGAPRQTKGEPRDAGLSPESVDAWMKEFGFDSTPPSRE